MTSLQPPGETSYVAARRVLVLAPHYDDEVVGCGGLLVRLVGAGAEVKVLFLTDGTGGDEGLEDRVAYSQRRRQEAEAAARVLGVTIAGHLDLPDGGLAQHREALTQGIRSVFLERRPDLVLVPSPLEVTSDHRAAFAALGDVLAPLRPGDELEEAVRGLSILVYEVNHPAYPDLLVDVSQELAKLEEAMRCYTSQQERHDYLAAAVGLRRYRTLSLPKEVTAAEGYRRLDVSDFTTRSPSQLISHLGGAVEHLQMREGPGVSVIVRTKDRPELLQEALESLAASTYRRVELVLVNDGGAPPEVSDDYPFPVVRVDLPKNRGRAKAADAGVKAATGEFIGFLDDDDLFAPEHLETLTGAVAGGDVRVVYSDAAVGTYELDSGRGWHCRERRLPYSRDFDPDLLLLDNYIPFNTLLVDRRLFAEVGPFDHRLPFFEDWDFLIRLAVRVPFHHLRSVTCEYRHFEGGGHHILGGAARDRPDFLEMKARVLAKHASSLTRERLARAIDTLRAELVERNGEVESARQELAERQQEYLGELEASSRELRRLYDEERELRQALDDHSAHLGRTYTEIERLNDLIRRMERTRAWRFHQWWQRTWL